MRRTAICTTLALTGVAAVWFGTQTVSQEHGPDPHNKVFVASWLDAELWLNPWIVGLGVLLLVAAVVLFAAYPRLTRHANSRT